MQNENKPSACRQIASIPYHRTSYSYKEREFRSLIELHLCNTRQDITFYHRNVVTYTESFPSELGQYGSPLGSLLPHADVSGTLRQAQRAPLGHQPSRA